MGCKYNQELFSFFCRLMEKDRRKYRFNLYTAVCKYFLTYTFYSLIFVYLFRIASDFVSPKDLLSLPASLQIVILLVSAAAFTLLFLYGLIWLSKALRSKTDHFQTRWALHEMDFNSYGLKAVDAGFCQQEVLWFFVDFRKKIHDIASPNNFYLYCKENEKKTAKAR